MKCFQCGKDLTPKVGFYQFEDKYTGTISLNLENSRECKHCNEVLLSWIDAERVEKAQEAALEETLQNQPVNSYISAGEAMKILGMKTKQSFYQHRRIKRGFIFQTQFDGRKMYLRESVERYKKKGDGRFKLSKGFASTAAVDQSILETLHALVEINEFRRIPYSRHSSSTPMALAISNKTNGGGGYKYAER